MNGFYIEIANGLLQGHRKRMGSSVWEFMWLIDKITRVDEDGTGWVLGGKPIKLSEIAEDLEIREDHISQNLSKLEKEGYIVKIRTPHGLTIKVAKAKKRFGQKVESDLGKRQNHTPKKAKSNKTRQRTRQLDSKINFLQKKTFNKTREKIQEIRKTNPIFV